MFELTPYFRNNRKAAQVYDPFREMEIWSAASLEIPSAPSVQI